MQGLCSQLVNQYPQCLQMKTSPLLCLLGAYSLVHSHFLFHRPVNPVPANRLFQMVPLLRTSGSPYFSPLALARLAFDFSPFQFSGPCSGRQRLLTVSWLTVLYSWNPAAAVMSAPSAYPGVGPGLQTAAAEASSRPSGLKLHVLPLASGLSQRGLIRF